MRAKTTTLQALLGHLFLDLISFDVFLSFWHAVLFFCLTRFVHLPLARRQSLVQKLCLVSSFSK